MYYVYENWVAEKKVVIHKGSCSFCNNGNGIQQIIHHGLNGKWHGPFDTYNNAKEFTEAVKDRTKRDCSFCKPWKN